MQDDSLSKGDLARLEILQAAKELFLSQGYNGTSMRAIARAAGDRAVAGLYNHFPTKETIFEALLEELNPYQELFGALEEAAEGATTAPELVRKALRNVMSVMPKHSDFIQLVQIDAREFEGKYLKQVLQTHVLPRIMEIVTYLQSLPGLHPITPVVWMRMMASLMIGYMLTERHLKPLLFEDWSHIEWADQFADALLYGIAAPDQE